MKILTPLFLSLSLLMFGLLTCPSFAVELGNLDEIIEHLNANQRLIEMGTPLKDFASTGSANQTTTSSDNSGNDNTLPGPTQTQSPPPQSRTDATPPLSYKTEKKIAPGLRRLFGRAAQTDTEGKKE